MNDSLDEELKNEYWGYIYLDKEGQIKHKRKTSKFMFIRKIGAFLEEIYSSIDLFIIPRDQHSYQGMLSWHQVGNVISMYGLVAQSDVSLSQISLLHEELLNIAQKRENVNWIYTSTWVPRKIIERLGYHYVREDTGGVQKYRRPVNHP